MVRLTAGLPPCVVCSACSLFLPSSLINLLLAGHEEAM